eukprot:TRINITY_DN2029_c0_g1_i1.p1 TRINITY_DN2029_c0_g1~~TRINITY_DN2029_c0_g1_i1.p1  ORF type:complete len:3335 (+),score=771.36 TRINITY_DN2029_c0_g1_i1:211-10215(+)
MFKKLVKLFTKKYINTIFSDFDYENFSLKLLDGDVKIKYAKFTNEFFQLHFPFLKLIDSELRNIEIVIPWRKLTNLETSIYIEKAFIHCELIEEYYFPLIAEEILLKRKLLKKQLELEAWEISQMLKKKYKEERHNILSILVNILQKSLIINILEMQLIFHYKPQRRRLFDSAFFLELKVHNFIINPADMLESGYQKTAKMDYLGVNVGFDEDESNNTLKIEELLNIDFSFVFSVSFTNSTVSFEPNVNVNQLSIYERQIAAIFFVLTHFRNYFKLLKFRDIRPVVSIDEDPKQWLKYAFQIGLKKTSQESYLTALYKFLVNVKDRSEYSGLYLQFFDVPWKTKRITKSLLKRFDELEAKHSVNELIEFRKYSRRLLTHRYNLFIMNNEKPCIRAGCKATYQSIKNFFQMKRKKIQTNLVFWMIGVDNVDLLSIQQKFQFEMHGNFSCLDYTFEQFKGFIGQIECLYESKQILGKVEKFNFHNIVNIEKSIDFEVSLVNKEIAAELKVEEILLNYNINDFLKTLAIFLKKDRLSLIKKITDNLNQKNENFELNFVKPIANFKCTAKINQVQVQFPLSVSSSTKLSNSNTDMDIDRFVFIVKNINMQMKYFEKKKVQKLNVDFNDCAMNFIPQIQVQKDMNLKPKIVPFIEKFFGFAEITFPKSVADTLFIQVNLSELNIRLDSSMIKDLLRLAQILPPIVSINEPIDQYNLVKTYPGICEAYRQHLLTNENIHIQVYSPCILVLLNRVNFPRFHDMGISKGKSSTSQPHTGSSSGISGALQALQMIKTMTKLKHAAISKADTLEIRIYHLIQELSYGVNALKTGVYFDFLDFIDVRKKPPIPFGRISGHNQLMKFDSLIYGDELEFYKIKIDSQFMEDEQPMFVLPYKPGLTIEMVASGDVSIAKKSDVKLGFVNFNLRGDLLNVIGSILLKSIPVELMKPLAIAFHLIAESMSSDVDFIENESKLMLKTDKESCKNVIHENQLKLSVYSFGIRLQHEFYGIELFGYDFAMLQKSCFDEKSLHLELTKFEVNYTDFTALNEFNYLFPTIEDKRYNLLGLSHLSFELMKEEEDTSFEIEIGSVEMNFLKKSVLFVLAFLNRYSVYKYPAVNLQFYDMEPKSRRIPNFSPTIIDIDVKNFTLNYMLVYNNDLLKNTSKLALITNIPRVYLYVAMKESLFDISISIPKINVFTKPKNQFIEIFKLVIICNFDLKADKFIDIAVHPRDVNIFVSPEVLSVLLFFSLALKTELQQKSLEAGSATPMHMDMDSSMIREESEQTLGLERKMFRLITQVCSINLMIFNAKNKRICQSIVSNSEFKVFLSHIGLHQLSFSVQSLVVKGNTDSILLLQAKQPNTTVNNILLLSLQREYFVFLKELHQATRIRCILRGFELHSEFKVLSDVLSMLLGVTSNFAKYRFEPDEVTMVNSYLRSKIPLGFLLKPNEIVHLTLKVKDTRIVLGKQDWYQTFVIQPNLKVKLNSSLDRPPVGNIKFIIDVFTPPGELTHGFHDIQEYQLCSSLCFYVCSSSSVSALVSDNEESDEQDEDVLQSSALLKVEDDEENLLDNDSNWTLEVQEQIDETFSTLSVESLFSLLDSDNIDLSDELLELRREFFGFKRELEEKTSMEPIPGEQLASTIHLIHRVLISLSNCEFVLSLSDFVILLRIFEQFRSQFSIDIEPTQKKMLKKFASDFKVCSSVCSKLHISSFKNLKHVNTAASVLAQFYPFSLLCFMSTIKSMYKEVLFKAEKIRILFALESDNYHVEKALRIDFNEIEASFSSSKGHLLSTLYFIFNIDCMNKTQFVFEPFIEDLPVDMIFGRKKLMGPDLLNIFEQTRRALHSKDDQTLSVGNFIRSSVYSQGNIGSQEQQAILDLKKKFDQRVFLFFRQPLQLNISPSIVTVFANLSSFKSFDHQKLWCIKQKVVTHNKLNIDLQIILYSNEDIIADFSLASFESQETVFTIPGNRLSLVCENTPITHISISHNIEKWGSFERLKFKGIGEYFFKFDYLPKHPIVEKADYLNRFQYQASRSSSGVNFVISVTDSTEGIVLDMHSTYCLANNLTFPLNIELVSSSKCEFLQKYPYLLNPGEKWWLPFISPAGGINVHVVPLLSKLDDDLSNVQMARPTTFRILLDNDRIQTDTFIQTALMRDKYQQNCIGPCKDMLSFVCREKVEIFYSGVIRTASLQPLITLQLRLPFKSKIGCYHNIHSFKACEDCVEIDSGNQNIAIYSFDHNFDLFLFLEIPELKLKSACRTRIWKSKKIHPITTSLPLLLIEEEEHNRSNLVGLNMIVSDSKRVSESHRTYLRACNFEVTHFEWFLYKIKIFADYLVENNSDIPFILGHPMGGRINEQVKADNVIDLYKPFDFDRDYETERAFHFKHVKSVNLNRLSCGYVYPNQSKLYSIFNPNKIGCLKLLNGVQYSDIFNCDLLGGTSAILLENEDTFRSLSLNVMKSISLSKKLYFTHLFLFVNNTSNDLQVFDKQLNHLTTVLSKEKAHLDIPLIDNQLILGLSSKYKYCPAFSPQIPQEYILPFQLSSKGWNIEELPRYKYVLININVFDGIYNIYAKDLQIPLIMIKNYTKKPVWIKQTSKKDPKSKATDVEFKNCIRIQPDTVCEFGLEKIVKKPILSVDFDFNKPFHIDLSLINNNFIIQLNDNITVDVLVEMDGPTTVISFSDAQDTVAKGIGTSVDVENVNETNSRSNLLNIKQSSKSQNNNIVEANLVGIYIPGVLINIFDSIPSEQFILAFLDTSLLMFEHEGLRTIEFECHRIQFDDLSVLTVFPSIFAPYYPLEENSFDCFSIKDNLERLYSKFSIISIDPEESAQQIICKRDKNAVFMFIEQYCQTNEFKTVYLHSTDHVVNLTDSMIFRLIDIVKSMNFYQLLKNFKHFRAEKFTKNQNRPIDETEVLKLVNPQYFFNELVIHGTKVYLSFESEASSTCLADIAYKCNNPVMARLIEPSEVRKSILGKLGFLTGITEAAIVIKTFKLQNQSAEAGFYVNLLKEFYVENLTSQIWSIIGSVEILGNPRSLFGEKEIDLKYYSNDLRGEKFDNILKTKCSNVKTEMTVNAAIGRKLFGFFAIPIGSISNALGKGIAGISMDSSYIDKEKASRREKLITQKQTNIATKNSFIYGFKKGFTGVYTIPKKEVHNEGMQRLLPGIGKGLVGLVTKPVAGTSLAVSKFLKGSYNSFLMSKSLLHVRHPRVISNCQIQKVNLERERYQFLLRMSDISLLFDILITFCNFDDEGHCWWALTDRHLLFGEWISDDEIKIVWMIDFDNILFIEKIDTLTIRFECIHPKNTHKLLKLTTETQRDYTFGQFESTIHERIHVPLGIHIKKHS